MQSPSIGRLLKRNNALALFYTGKTFAAVLTA